MGRHLDRRWAWTAAAVAAACLLVTLPSRDTPAEGPRPLVVVVHPQNPIRAGSAADVVDLFTARRQFWTGGVRVTIVLQKPPGALAAAFLSRVLHMSADDLERLFLQKRYRGVLVSRVSVVDGPAEGKALVARETTAIGYLWADETDESVRVFREF